MRKFFVVLFLIACNTDSARVAQLEKELKECRAQSAQGNPSAPSGTMAASPRIEEITVGGRTYEVLPILRGEEESATSSVMVARAKEAGAHLGKDDGEHLLAHQGDIPVALRGKVVFVFTDWPHPYPLDDVTYVVWGIDRWVRNWHWLDGGWRDLYRVLRRKS